MASYNKVLLMGNLTRDPEVRVTPGGMTICKLAIAVNRKFKGQDGQEREEVTYVDIESFGKQAEIVSKYFGKGRPIFVEGRLRLDRWDDKTSGEKRSKMVVVLEQFTFVDSQRGGGGGDAPGGGDDYNQSAPPPRAPARASAPAPASRPPPPAENIDEDVPF